VSEICFFKGTGKGTEQCLFGCTSFATASDGKKNSRSSGEVGKAMGWKASRCRNIQISELFSMETCDQAVMDFLAATDIGKFPAQVS